MSLTRTKGAWEILKVLGEVSFETVYATFKAGRQNLKIGAKTAEVYERYLKDQSEVRGNSAYHIRDVKKWVGKICKKFPDELIPISKDQIQDWLKGLGGKARTEEMRNLLAAASETIRPTLEFKAFSGIRTEEMVRFWWVFAKILEKVIQIPKEVAKLNFRTIPMLENLERRLAAYDPSVRNGKVCKKWNSANSLYHAWLRVCKKAGVPYKKNAFRDSYITYRLALTNDIKLVEMESGNSEKMIRENYLHLTTKEAALEWFSI